ncbi:MAG TPA: hypothetical protein VFZ18_15830 [Longimicrobiaceae bacterium]
MKRSPLLLLLAVAACSSASTPAGPPPSYVTPLMLQPPPIYALLGYRERLELTTEQIVGLDSIATGLKEENDDLIDELEEKSSLTRSQTALIVGDEGKPVLEQIRENNRGAAEAVGRLLTSEQQVSTCDLFRLERDERSRRGRGQQQRERRGVDQAAADSIWRALEARTWPWCGTAAASGDTPGTPVEP